MNQLAVIDLPDRHTRCDLQLGDADLTASRMVSTAVVMHVATLSGMVGREALRSYYADAFITAQPPDTSLDVVARPLGDDVLVDECIKSPTHDRVIPPLLPGIPAAGSGPSRAEVGDIPVILSAPSRNVTVSDREQAVGLATRDLLSPRVIVVETVDPSVSAILVIHGRPERQLAMRVVTPAGTMRVSVVRRDCHCVVARRMGAGVGLWLVSDGAALCFALTALCNQLPAGRPAAIGLAAAPLHDMAEALSAAGSNIRPLSAVRALGVPPQRAMGLGAALASREVSVEIVLYALNEQVGQIIRVPIAVVVYYTKRGPMIAAPRATSTEQLWVTPGSHHGFRQATGQLVGLSDQPRGTVDNAA